MRQAPGGARGGGGAQRLNEFKWIQLPHLNFSVVQSIQIRFNQGPVRCGQVYNDGTETCRKIQELRLAEGKELEDWQELCYVDILK